MRATLLLAATAPALTGCTATLDAFERTLAAQDSATAALREWCAARGIAAQPIIRAERIRGEDSAPSAETRRLLNAGPDEPIGYRHVRLSCDGEVLSVAHNWYLPARLTPEMNRTLDTSDTPFGRVAAPLRFTRRRLAETRGPLPGCPPDTVLAHRAVLELPDGRPLSALLECYTAANLRAR